MNICIIGQNFGEFNEGMRNITHHISRSLAKHCNIFNLYQRDAFALTKLLSLYRFKPDVIHYLHGPSLQTFCILKWLSVLYPKAKTVVSATQPKMLKTLLSTLPLLKPTLVLVQSRETADLFRKFGCDIAFFPNGVDIDKFKPVSIKEKMALREKYSVGKDRFVILHIGSLRSSRNLQILSKLQRNSRVQIVLLGSMHVHEDFSLTDKVMSSGVKIIKEFIPNVEELYQLSDCYIFPVVDDLGAIEFPLTVLEAMACNIPVVTTRFKSLPYFLTAGEGLYFYDNEQELVQYINQIMSGVRTSLRERVLPFSWDNIAKALENIYGSIVANGECRFDANVANGSSQDWELQDHVETNRSL